MSRTIKVALAGAGAFGIKHLDAIKLIDGVEVVSLVSRDLGKTKEVAAKYGIGHARTFGQEAFQQDKRGEDFPMGLRCRYVFHVQSFQPLQADQR